MADKYTRIVGSLMDRVTQGGCICRCDPNTVNSGGGCSRFERGVALAQKERFGLSLSQHGIQLTGNARIVADTRKRDHTARIHDINGGDAAGVKCRVRI